MGWTGVCIYIGFGEKGVDTMSVRRKMVWKRLRAPRRLCCYLFRQTTLKQPAAPRLNIQTIKRTWLCVRTLPYSATDTMHKDAMAHKPILLRARARTLCLSPSHSTVMVALKPPSPPAGIKWQLANAEAE